MKIEVRNMLLLCVAQILGILGWYGCGTIYRLYLRQPYITTKPYLFVISPPLIAATVSLVFSFLLPVKVDLKKAILISIPATLVYFGFYILVPYIVIEFNAEILPFFCFILIPITISTIIINGLAIWLGSLLRTKIHKRKNVQSGCEVDSS